MAGVIYFGNRSKQAYIPSPQSGLEWSLARRSNLIQLENGGVFVDDSKASHREAVPEWAGSPDELRPIRDFAHGVWGDGPFYMIDPYAQDTNLLSPHWSTPGIIADGDWPSIHSSAPVAHSVMPGPLGTPTRAVTYNPTNSSSAATPAERFTILIPPGYRLAFGAHGTRTGAGVIVLRGTTASGVTSTTTLAPLDPTGSVSYSSTTLFPYSGGFRFVDIFLGRSSATSSSLTLSAMRARLLKETETIATSNVPFVSGDGTGNLSFSGPIREVPEWIGQRGVGRRKRLSVKLVEVW